MIVYLLKSSAVLFIILLFYKIFLEKEKAFVFNRGYLWLGLAFSFLSPLFVYEVPVDWVLVQNSDVLGDWANTVVSDAQFTERIIKEENTIDWLYLGSMVYTFLCGILLIRFIVNLSKMLYRVSSSEYTQLGKYKIVSNKSIDAPFSFFNYIFLPLNYDASILEHEKRHADAYHSIDVLILELIQIIAWVNPLVFWHKRLVSLNHEFFADYQKNSGSVKRYQKLIFSHISKNKDNLLASGFNYSFIKKRMIMLQRSRSGPLLWAKKVMVIPLFAILLVAACEKVEAQQSASSQQKIKRQNELVVVFDGKSSNDNRILSVDGNRVLNNSELSKLVLQDGLLAFDQVNVQVGSKVYEGKNLNSIVFSREKEELFMRKLEEGSSVVTVKSKGQSKKKFRAIRLGEGQNWSAGYFGNEIPPPPPPPAAAPAPPAAPVAPSSSAKSTSYESIPPPPPPAPANPAKSASFQNIPPPPPPAPEPSPEPRAEPIPPPPPPVQAEPSAVPAPPPPPPPPTGPPIFQKETKEEKMAKLAKTPKPPKPPKAPKKDDVKMEIKELKAEIKGLEKEQKKDKKSQEKLKQKQKELKKLQEKLSKIN